MGAFRAKGLLGGRGFLCAAAVAACWPTAGAAAQRDGWQAAVADRAAFEAQPAGHSRAGYVRAMEEFRAIYHADPGDPHAARAAEQVAELLVEQGRELADRKSLHDAAAQYEWLAKAYPGGTLAPHALAEAVVLYGNESDGNDSERVARFLRATYPSSAEAHELVQRPSAAGSNSTIAKPSTGTATTPSVSSGEHYHKPIHTASTATTASTRNDAANPVARPTASNPAPLPMPDDMDQPAPASAVTASHYRKPVHAGSGTAVASGNSLANPVARPTATNPAPLPMPDDAEQTAPAAASTGSHYRKPAAKPDQSTAVGASASVAGGGEKQALPLRGRTTSRDLGDASGSAPDPGAEQVAAVPGQASGGPAMVTAIRHWSTSTYTRVAIDLGDEVQYQAARVENPDRIFFDLHHAKLAPQLVGKSFNVTDDGFLTRIRAAQFSGDVTRVVLDVHEVADYSAFLLPNPYRLIIDIHGKAPVERAEATATQDAAAGASLSNDETVAKTGHPAEEPQVAPAPIVRGEQETRQSNEEVSSLPPMPVTDGSSSFGLPPKRSSVTGSDRSDAGAVTSSGTSSTVARPRVVIPSKPTTAKPVPNAVATRSAETGSEVAAVSDQPGKVVATNAPTSQPISAKSGERAGTTRRRGNAPAHVAGAPVEAAPPTADGETSLMRALGLKIGRIVIDAGHGGHDSGTLGVGGIEEKDVVLDVALRLGKLLHDRLGADIVYTRADDTFIPLETRTAIANKAQADLFISVHANSSPDPSARGVEVYYLNFTSDPDAMTVASRENAVSTKSVHELSDLVKKIALKDKIEESHELASDVDQSLYAGLAKGNDGLKDRGVKKAPFVVLIGANMPSVLAEISFVTNPDDADELDRPAYRQRVAESLYKGIARYAAGINAGKTNVASAERAASE